LNRLLGTGEQEARHPNALVLRETGNKAGVGKTRYPVHGSRIPTHGRSISLQLLFIHDLQCSYPYLIHVVFFTVGSTPFIHIVIFDIFWAVEALETGISEIVLHVEGIMQIFGSSKGGRGKKQGI